MCKKNFRVLEIFADVNGRYRHHAHTRVVEACSDDVCQFALDQFGYAMGSTEFPGHATSLQCRSDLYLAKDLELIAYFDIVVVFHAYTTFEAGFDFSDVFFEAPQ